MGCTSLTPHNHAKWELEKKARLAKRKLEKAKKENDNAKANQAGGAALKKHKGGVPNKLALSKTMKSMLCTDFCTGEADATAWVDKVMAAVDAASQDDNESKNE